MSSCMLFMVLIVVLANVSSFRQRQWRRNTHSLDSSPKSLTDETKRGLVSAVLPGFVAVLAAIKPAYADRADKADKRFYLDAPTSDFVEEEKRTKSLAAEGLKLRKEWDAAEIKMEKAETAAEKEGALREFIAILNKVDGVPPGVKKIPLVKLCRSKKFSDAKMRKKQETWTKNVEIAYQELIFLFNKKIAPDNRSADKI